MKKLLKYSPLLSLLIFVGCCDASSRAYNNVRRAFPDAEIVNLPGTTLYFLVREKNGTVWYIYSEGSPNDIWDNNKNKIFLPKE